MIQTSYLSRASEAMSAEALLALLMQSRRNNDARGLTGMLLCGNGTFLQVLEGDDEVVDRLVETIAADPRHTAVRILSRKPIERRQYTEWSMGFERVTDQGLKQVAGLRDFGASDFNLDFLARNQAVVDTLMEHYRGPHWDPLVRELDAKDKVIDHLRNDLTRARGCIEVASLVIESVTEAGRKGPLSEEHLRMCESALGSLR